MKLLMVGLAISALVGLPACSSVSGAWGSRSAVSIAGKTTTRNVGTLFVWEGDVNAAVLTSSGSVCMQRAMTANAESIGVSGDLSDSILRLSGAVASGGANTEEANQSLVTVSGTLGQSISSLSTSTERTAFLDIGLFYICQLGANKSIRPDQAQKLTVSLIEAAARMSPTPTQTTTVGEEAPRLRREGEPPSP